MSQIRWTMTSRGFKHYEPVEITRGNAVRVFESSAADGPHLWLMTDHPDGHMTLEQATLLRDTLTTAIERHYQTFVHDPKVWKPDDVCLLCGSVDTGLDGDVAYCNGCNSREDHRERSA